MNKIVCLLLGGAVVACALASCATTPKSKYPSVNWRSLERRETYSAPMAFLPEMEIYGLRIPLLDQLTSYEEPSDANTRVRTSYKTADVGLDLGNGLAIDAVGNIFLDVLKLLQIDKSRGFDVRYGPVRLWRDETGVRYSTRTAKDLAVELTETSEYVVATLGKTGYERKDNLYKFTAPLPIRTSYDLTVDEDRITLTARDLRRTTATIAKGASSIDFHGRYTIRKTGDTYSIACNAIAGIPVYSLYVADRRLYFCEGDKVRKRIEIGPNEILVNGKRAVMYDVQGGG